ncbi:MAG: molybdopterin molybdenumtransferase MoeA, partial [Bacteroidota bacterium]
MISARAARAHVLRSTHALPAVRVPLLEANGRVLAASIRAPFPLPRFTDSAMDGYAIRASETR